MSEHERVDKRADFETQVRMRSPTAAEFDERFTANVSTTGMFVLSDEPMAKSTLLKLELEIDSDAVKAVGRVVWRRPAELAKEGKPAGMGIKFIKIDETSKKRIESLVDERGGDELSHFDRGPESLPPEARMTDPPGEKKVEAKVEAKAEEKAEAKAEEKADAPEPDEADDKAAAAADQEEAADAKDEGASAKAEPGKKKKRKSKRERKQEARERKRQRRLDKKAGAEAKPSTREAVSEKDDEDEPDERPSKSPSKAKANGGKKKSSAKAKAKPAKKKAEAEPTPPAEEGGLAGMLWPAVGLVGLLGAIAIWYFLIRP